MKVFKVYKQVYDYETESSKKEYLPECFTSVQAANTVCELHKKIDNGIYLFEPFEIGKVYESAFDYKKENKDILINKKIDYIKKQIYPFNLLQADDFGDFIKTHTYLSIEDMNKIIDKFKKTNKQSIQIHNYCFDLIKVKQNDLEKIIKKKEEIDNVLKKLETKLGLKHIDDDTLKDHIE